MRNIIVLTIAMLIAAPSAQAAHSGDPEQGAKIFKKCKSCHQVGKGAKNRVGPQLNGIFGRPAGSIEDFRYSKGLRRMGDDGLVWTFETLDAYIENPKALVSKTRMNFKGLPVHEDRDDLLAYLRTFSDDPANIPEAAPTVEASDHTVDPAILAIVGDPAYGQYLSGECVTCHLADGGDEGIPSITSWPAEDFVIALHAYRDKVRPHPVMQLITSRLSNEEIAALAAYFQDLE